MPERIIIQDAKLLLPTGINKENLLIQDGKIQAIGRDIKIHPSDLLIDASNKYVLPGFVDIHNHGAMGFDTSFGMYDSEEETFSFAQDSYMEGFELYQRFNLRHGTTRMLATSMAAPWEGLEKAFTLIRQYSERNLQGLANQLAGINVEGCYLKDPEYAGAQNPAFFYLPNPEKFEALQKAAGNRIAMVNVPPEHGEAGLGFIESLKANGIAVAGGHSSAHFDTFTKAIDAGLSISVHFFNGPSRNSTKSFHGGGAEQAMLQDDRVSLELIVDGYHVHPACARDAMARKGFDKIILITDSMFVNGQENLSAFDLAGLKGSLSENKAYLQMLGTEDTLFGSVLCMDKGFSNVLTWLMQDMKGFWYRRHEALGFEEALLATSKMASENPARQLKLFETSPKGIGTGSIEVGKWADLLIGEINLTEGNYEVEIEKVFLKGLLA